MGVYPKPIGEQIAFLTAHLPVWTTNKVALGLTDTQLTELTTLLSTANLKLTAAEQARIASKAATLQLNTAVETMGVRVRSAISLIKANADLNPALYALAQIDPPAPPTPLGPPQPATDITLSLNPLGNVVINWKGKITSRTFYKILRALDGAPTFAHLDSISANAYEDKTLPEGTTSAVYQVVAVRGVLESTPTPPVTIQLFAQPSEMAEAA